MSGKYDDMLHLPHHVSPKRPQMSLADRAAQFSPFAALTGYEAAIRETERLTTERIELDESAKASLDEKLRVIVERLPEEPEVTITYFQPDVKKDGGAYLTITGAMQKLDTYESIVVMMDGTRIPIDDIVEIESDLLKSMY